MEKNRSLQTKQLVTDAMLIAMYIVLSLVSANFGDKKITLDGLPIIIGAALFGPVDGLLIGLFGSFTNQMLTYGLMPTTVLWIIPAGARGLFVGWYAKKNKFSMTLKQTVFIVILSALLVTTLNTGVMYIDSKIYGYYSYAYIFGGIIFRYAMGILTAVVFAAILPALLKIIQEKVVHKPNGKKDTTRTHY